MAKKVQDCVEARIASELEKRIFVDSSLRERPPSSASAAPIESLPDVENAADQVHVMGWGSTR